MADSAKPFRTHHEDGCVPGFDDQKPAAALVICADAAPLAVAGAALARADTLRRSLLAWSCIGGAGCVEASEVAQALEPMAHEVLMLLDDLTERLGRAERAALEGPRHG